MTLDLSTQALVNASSGLLFLALGVFALAVGRRDPWPRAIGACAASFGAFFVVRNLWPEDAQFPYAWLAVSGALLIAVTASTALLAWRLVASGLSGRRAWAFRAFVAATLIITLADALLGWNGSSPARATPWRVAVYIGYTVPFRFAVAAGAALVAAAALRHGEAPDPRERRHLAALAVSFGLYYAFNASTQVVTLARAGPDLAPIAFVVALYVPSLAGPLTWAASMAGPGTRSARSVLLVLLSTVVLGMVASVTFDLRGNRDLGIPGIIRTLAALVLALAIVRDGLLRVPLPRVSVRRGPLAAAALATLLVVAQVAQNFLSAQMGLLTGGVVAGALLFAAAPIQRAVERFGSDRPSPPPRTADPSRLEESERAYKIALRRFLAEGRITPEEEIALAHLADEAGLTIKRVTQLRHEVERELAGSRAAE